jgi:mannose-1-phosphate guanylyltransferase
VAAFREKPDGATAMLVKDGCLWNSRILLMRAASLIAELETHEPRVLAAVREALAKAEADADFLRLDAEAFGASPSIAIDHAVLERTRNAPVVVAAGQIARARSRRCAPCGSPVQHTADAK